MRGRETVRGDSLPGFWGTRGKSYMEEVVKMDARRKDARKPVWERANEPWSGWKIVLWTRRRAWIDALGVA